MGTSKGMKAKVRAYKKRLTYIATAVTAAIIIGVVIISGFLIYSWLNPAGSRPFFKAAIVDHLSIATPNQTFVQTATSILEEAKFSVDYYDGQLVTVEFYRSLPTHGYNLIILRVHSTTHDPETGVQHSGLFTSELFNSTKYIYERNTLQVGVVAFLPYHEGDPLFFGITSRFIVLSMVGRFENTTVIMMGCWGLKYSDMAEAFIAKGAKVYISWSDEVLIDHTDSATIVLLQHLISQGHTVEQAVTETMGEVGSDPQFKSVLRYYPSKAGSYTVGYSMRGIMLSDAISLRAHSRKEEVLLDFLGLSCRSMK